MAQSHPSQNRQQLEGRIWELDQDQTWLWPTTTAMVLLGGQTCLGLPAHTGHDANISLEDEVEDCKSLGMDGSIVGRLWALQGFASGFLSSVADSNAEQRSCSRRLNALGHSSSESEGYALFSTHQDLPRLHLCPMPRDNGTDRLAARWQLDCYCHAQWELLYHSFLLKPEDDLVIHPKILTMGTLFFIFPNTDLPSLPILISFPLSVLLRHLRLHWQLSLTASCQNAAQGREHHSAIGLHIA
jgi:hypothetical protein